MLVQLVRMPPCHGGGHGFESRTHRETLKHNVLSALQRVGAESTVGTNGMNDVRYCSLIRLEWPLSVVDLRFKSFQYRNAMKK